MNDICVGEFDWIVDYNYLKEFFHSKEIEINNYKVIDVLVIGCGTSTLSYSILESLEVNSIVSLDNDKNCINYMKEKYKNYNNMLWIVYDLVENYQIKENNQEEEKKLEEDNIQNNNDNDNYEENMMKTASYDLIVDKGTLDAVLVEGSIAIMLHNIYRVLKNGGIYFLCSLHSPTLLEPLLSSIPLLMSVKFLGDCGTEDGKCKTVAICKKINDNHYLDLNQIIETETRIMNQFYQETQPLLTLEDKNIIQKLFEAQNTTNLPFNLIHHLIFDINGPLHSMGYTIDLFLEDVEEFPVSQVGCMNCNEFFDFLSSKQ